MTSWDEGKKDVKTLEMTNEMTKEAKIRKERLGFRARFNLSKLRPQPSLEPLRQTSIAIKFYPAQTKPL
jgi:hypothetical protein